MRTIVIGGGKVGAFILKTLAAASYDVTLIEREQGVCTRLAEETEAVILCGDGTDPVVLMDADIQDADMVAAVTGKDEENLVICQIAKLRFGVKKTISRVNNPKNVHLFELLGVDRTVCSTEVIANLIEWELEDHRLRTVQAIDTGGLALVEATIGQDNFWVGRLLDTLRLPVGVRIVALVRAGLSLENPGQAVLAAGDRLLMLSGMKERAPLEQAIFEVVQYGY